MTTLFEGLLAEFEVFFEPLVDAAEGEGARRRLFEAIDLDLTDAEVSNLQGRFDALKSATESITRLADGSDGEAMEDVLAALETVGHVFDALHGIESDLPDVGDADVVGDLIEYLVLQYLFARRPTLLQALVVLTVVDVPPPAERNAGDGRRSTVPGLPAGTSLEVDRAGDLLSDPASTLADAYAPAQVTEPDEAARIARLLFPPLTRAAGALGFRIADGTRELDLQDYGGVPNLTVASRTLTLLRDFENGTLVGVRLALASSDDGLCLYLVPFGGASLDVPVGDWSFSLSLGAGFDVVVLDPDGIAHASPRSGEVQGEAGIEKTGGADGNAAVLGPSKGTRLELGTLGASGDWTLSSETTEVGIEAKAGDSSFVVDAGSADSFLEKVLPADGVTVDFDAGIGWHTERGLYFAGGGAGLATDLPVNVDIAGVVKVETLRLAAKAEPSGGSVTVPVRVAADPQVTIGPMDAAVEGIGLEAEIGFPEDDSGNLGPLSVDLGFKPPTGAGLSLDSGVVTGGGYLSFDRETERYAGVLQLKIGDLTITAVGLLTTRLPGGRDGFSLLLIIAGEFPPVQLGFGFTLTGLGGLIGANRSIDVDYLTAGLSDGTVRSIMFPEDPVRNAPQIVSDLRTGFPVAAGNHVIGPMAELGWGTPSMLSASLGVLLDVPSPIRIVLLGRLHAGLPHEEAGIVVFNMDLLGAVDVEAQSAHGAATLYDSRIVAYVVSGDMAVETGWGANATFVLSVGGFNPRFEPPPDFPALDRIALSIGPGNPEVRFSGYFAVTSNTVQVGARVEAYAKAAGFAFEGKLGFDTLFRFEPFELIADFYAGFALRRGGSTLMSVDVDGTLSGPGPWHLRGTASFSIWPIDFSVSVDAEFGPSKSAEALSPADVFGQVVDALSDARNWSAQRPAGGESVVTLREVEREGDQVLAHPLGTVAVRQQVAPLAVRIEKFGNGKPAGYDRFRIVDVTAGGSDEGGGASGTGEPTREEFAPAEYFELSDDERLQGPEFERYEAGRRVTSAGFGYGGADDGGLLATDTLDYETAVVDERASLWPVHVGRIAMPRSTASAVASVSAVARGPLRTTGEARFEATDDATGPTGVETGLSVSDAKYVVVNASDMTRHGLDGVPAAGTTKREAEEALDAHLAATGDDRGDYRVVGVHEATGGADA